MNIQKILTISFLCMLIGCTKSSEELLDLSEKNVKSNQIDLAIDQLKTLLNKHPNDSLASKAQYKLASIYLNWKNDPAQGYKELQNTVSNYEESIQGQKAQNQITEFPEYLINKAESLQKQKMLKEALDHLIFMINKYTIHKLAPKAQYMLGDLYMNNFRDFTTAIQEYRKVLDNYTGSNQEPHALFMIGYIYANIINDEKSAKIEYNEFLNRFPNHELAPSVKFEVEYLGKSIEEIPALKHITS